MPPDTRPDPRIIPDRLCLPLSFDPSLLARDLDGLTGAMWVRHYHRQHYSGDWSVLPLRAPLGEVDPVRMIFVLPTCGTYAATRFLAICPYFQEVLAAFHCPILSARLMRLAAGSEIKEHTDGDMRFEEGLARIHIPVATNDEVEFVLNEHRVQMVAGSCWYLRLSDPHRVINRGSTDRVHLVVDVRANGWLTTLFRNQVCQQAIVSTSEPTAERTMRVVDTDLSRSDPSASRRLPPRPLPPFGRASPREP